jgi:hypothetical protein
MSNDTRTMLVVLVVCGFLMCGCIVLPIGVGAVFYLTASRQAQMAQAEVQRAVAAEQQARAQAEAARAQAQTMAPIAVPELTPIPAPPGIVSPTILPPGLTGQNLGDVEERKKLYAAFKQLRIKEEELKANSDDAALGILNALLQSTGVTREQIDQILAEGDKAGW